MPRTSKMGVAGLSRERGLYVFDYRYRDADGRPARYKRRFPVGTPAEAAKAWARRVLGEIQAGTFVAPAEQRERDAREHDARKPLGEVCTAYLERLRADGLEQAARDRAHHCKKLKAILGAKTALDEVTPLSLARIKRTIRDGGASNSTINRYLATFKHLVRFAHRSGWATAATLGLVVEEKLLKEPPGRVRWLSDDERGRLCAVLDELAASKWHSRQADRMLVLVAWLTGMRQAEVRTLRRAQLNLERREILLTRTKSNRTRLVRMPKALVPELRAYLERFPGEVLFPGRDDEAGEPVEPMTLSGAAKAWARVRDAAALTDFHYHDLRHDFATVVRRQGVDLDHIKELLGHTTMQMSSRYAHVGHDELAADVANLTTAGASTGATVIALPTRGGS